MEYKFLKNKSFFISKKVKSGLAQKLPNYFDSKLINSFISNNITE